MCKLQNPRKTNRKYCYKIYRIVNNKLYTLYTLHRHVIDKRYKAINVKFGRKIGNKDLLSTIECLPGDAPNLHNYCRDHIGFMGYADKTAEFPRKGEALVKCLMENTRIDKFNREVDCQYITPLEIIKKGKIC